MTAPNMKIKFHKNFILNLRLILDFITQNNPQNADEFEKNLFESLDKLKFMPYRCRKSFYSDDERVRDFVFKGYVAPYLIAKDEIIVLGIFKHKQAPKF